MFLVLLNVPHWQLRNLIALGNYTQNDLCNYIFFLIIIFLEYCRGDEAAQKKKNK